MIVGIGTDLCDARRIQASQDRFGARFLDRIYTADEQAHALGAALPHLSLAKRFAAKEAVAKAMGTGVRGFRFVDIEVVSGLLGKPHIILHGAAADALRRMVPDDMTGVIHVSMSDEDPYATAYAVIEAL